MRIQLFVALFVLCSAIDNGIGRLPPMGWRSWNAYYADVNQQKMMSAVDAITDKSRNVNGKPTSLADLGYVRVGLDDNWQACGKGINGSFHDANGRPLLNTNAFPDMKKWTDYAHSKQTLPGWYMNNCICGEYGKLQANWPPQMRGDTDAIISYGYDGVKIDGCGPSHDLIMWADLLNKTGHPVMIENCHDNTSFPYWKNPSQHDELVCPMNFWRVSDDINPHWASIISNLQNTIPFQDLQHPISQPGCWAYPDMLEVGNGDLTHDESESHFGAWCTVSSPLILGFDVVNSQKMDAVWDIITNTEAIAVSQNWAGHPGRLVSQANNQIQLSYYSKKKNMLKQSLVASWQIWGKKLTDLSQAAILINNADTPQTVSLKLTDLGFKPTDQITARDLWAHKDLPRMTGSSVYTVNLKAHQSSFIKVKAAIN